MSTHWPKFVVALASAVVWTGCGTGPPGAGVTNVEPAVIGGPEKAAERTDLPTPDPASGDAPLAESAASKPGSADTDAAPAPAPETKAPASAGTKGAEGSPK